MPGGDRKGPNGMGPMTGRGAGLCAGYATPGYMNPGYGGGFGCYGRGTGGGRGWRRQYYATGLPCRARYDGHVPYQNQDPALESEMLKRQADELRSQLDLIEKRISGMEKPPANG